MLPSVDRFQVEPQPLHSVLDSAAAFYKLIPFSLSPRVFPAHILLTDFAENMSL